MKKLFLIVSVLFVVTIFVFINKNHIKNEVIKKSYIKTTRSFEFILTGDEDIPEFFPGYLDFDPQTGSVLLLPRIFYSNVLLIDRDKNFYLLGHSGQSPSEINGRVSTAKFMGDNLIGLLTFFGDTAFLAMDFEGNVAKKWKLNSPFGRVYEYKVDGDNLYYADIVVLKDLNSSHEVVKKISLSNISKSKGMLSIKDLKNLFKKWQIPFAEFLDVYFLLNSDSIVISPHEGKVNFSRQGEYPFAIIFNLKTGKTRVCKLKSFFNSGCCSLKGVNIFNSIFYEGEIPGKDESLAKKIKNINKEFVCNYGGVLHLFNKNGEEKGVYAFYDDFYHYLLNNNFTNFYITKLRGLSQNKIICVGYLFEKGKKERKVVILKAKMKKLL